MKKANGNGLIKIERNVPPPPLSGHGNRKYPWNEMEVGDSFMFPAESRFGYEAARVATQRYKPKKFIARIQPDKGFRCWRVE